MCYYPGKGEKLRHSSVLLLGLLTPLYGQQATPGPPAFGWGERFAYYAKNTFGWHQIGLQAVDAGFDQLLRDPKYWARGANDYGCRYGTGFGQRVTRNSIELLAGAALHEDARFKPSGENRFSKRLEYAFKHALLATGDQGRERPAYSRLAATAGGVLLAYAWNPQPPTAPQVFQNLGFGLIGHLENSLLTEFSPDMKRFGRNLRRKIFKK